MSPAPEPRMGERERTVFLAMAMATAALGIDLILPAFADIRADLGLDPGSTQVAGLVSAYFIGMAVGQPLYGPASDRFGRRGPLRVSFGVYGVGAILAALSPNLTLLLVSRFLWGLGAAGARVITIAIVRDRYEGEAMSRAMSLIMAIFILVPVLAPTIGSLGLALGSWRWLLIACTAFAVAIAVWSVRLVESLAPEHRRAIGPRALWAASRVVVTTRTTLTAMLAMTLMYGGFTSYIASSEILIGEVFGAADIFPYLFGAIALAMGAGMLVNARYVERFGTNRLVGAAFGTYLGGAAAMVAVGLAFDGVPPMAVYLPALVLALASHSVLIPNLNAVAMQPMAGVAGMASAIIGALQLAAGAALGAVIDQAFDGTVMPLSTGFLVLGVGAALLARDAIRRQRTGADEAPAAVAAGAPISA